jgi:hypothetical protein
MTNLESFGSIKHYRSLILAVKDNKELWRKVANILNNLRRDTRPWPMVHRPTQLKVAEEYVVKALKDTRLPRDIKIYLIVGIMSEFGFKFEGF